MTFTPSTMQWSNFDTFYALGKDSEVGDPKTNNIWSKVSVIPANNVYYEDDFVTSTVTGTVGIEYSGEWNENGTSAGNKEQVNTEVHGGWVEGDTGLADDATYSDGSAHVSSIQGATATFTFTGTGVDVYSRTNLTTGLVKAQLYKGEEVTPSALTKVYTIDNKAASGDYYQIPTVSFHLPDYGTYTVRLTVVSTTGDAVRSTYYLDGIRVYNPLSVETEMDEVVTGAYGDEVGALFTEVRNILLDASDFDASDSEDTAYGVVFIDEMSDGNSGTASDDTTYEIGIYESFGPKNEVYLAQNQAIVFNVSDALADKFSVGIKAPAGTASAMVTNGDATTELNITYASDLYHEITPNSSGMIMIKNTGEKMLSITKLKMSAEASIEEVSVMSLMAYSNEFDELPVVANSPEETPEVDTEDNTGNVEIVNPENTQEEQNATEDLLRNWIENIFSSFRNWFNW